MVACPGSAENTLQSSYCSRGGGQTPCCPLPRSPFRYCAFLLPPRPIVHTLPISDLVLFPTRTFSCSCRSASLPRSRTHLPSLHVLSRCNLGSPFYTPDGGDWANHPQLFTIRRTGAMLHAMTCSLCPPSSVRAPQYIDNMNLFDIWRVLNPSGREYSFHARGHNVYSRIDFFLVDGKLLPYTFNPKYHNIIISDHGPVSFTLRLDSFTKPQRNWRFNPQLLENNRFCEYLESQIAFTNDTNDKDNISPVLLWETFKAFLRGCIISYQSSLKKKKVGLSNPANDKHNRISALKYKLNN